MTIVPLPTLGRREAASAALAAKHRLGVPWQKIAETLDRSLVWSASAVLGQHPLDAEQARAVARLLQLDDEVVNALQLPPVRLVLDTHRALVNPHRVIGGHLDDHQLEAVGVGDPHLVEPPRFAPRLPKHRYAVVDQISGRRGEVTNL